MDIKEVTAFNYRKKIRRLVLPGFDGVPVIKYARYKEVNDSLIRPYACTTDPKV